MIGLTKMNTGTLTTIILVGVLITVLGSIAVFIIFVGHVPVSIPMHVPEDGPCDDQLPNHKFKIVFGQQMPFSMTCADFNKLLNSSSSFMIRVLYNDPIVNLHEKLRDHLASSISGSQILT